MLKIYLVAYKSGRPSGGYIYIYIVAHFFFIEGKKSTAAYNPDKFSCA